MEKIRKPEYVTTPEGKLVCTNIKDIQADLKRSFPQEKIGRFAANANVSHQTWSRWNKKNRADGGRVAELVKTYNQFLNTTTDVPLSEATPEQVYDRCEQLGWDNVIRSGKQTRNQD